ncbi:MAG TPA: AraC family transcriptional regulator, partial [Planctomycetota bacterium]|nr:AraC family transcriptional regulator [Planctomycetota bacterium]
IARRISGLVAERERHHYPGGLLVALRSVQRSSITAGRFGPSWSQRLVLAKWVTAGAGELEVGGKRVRFEPGQMAIYLPSDPHRFWAVEETNRFCWFSTDGPAAEQLVRELGLETGVYSAPPPARTVISAIARSLEDRSIAGRRASSILAITEWYRIANAIGRQPHHSLVDQARFIIDQEFADPELTAAGIARRLRCHRGTLSRLFHAAVKQTLIGYLGDVRLRAAQCLLTTSTVALETIAAQCGIQDPAYFCRWIKKHTGHTAGQLRRQAQAEREGGP